MIKYKIRYQEKQKMKTLYLEAQNRSELQSHKNFPTNIINIKEQKNLSFDFVSIRNKKKDIFELFSQLDIMLSASLSFSESIEMLLQSQQETKIREILKIIEESLSSSVPLDIALKPYKNYLGNNTILFLKLGFENGNIKESIHSLVEILEEDIQSSEKFQEVMRYPLILILSLFVSVGMIFVYVLPNFDFVFSLLKDEIPTATKILLTLRDVFADYSIYIVIFLLVLIGVFIFLFKRYRYFFDKVLLLKIPILSKVIQDYHFYRLFLSISIIVKSKYQFQVAILNSKNIVNNLYVKEMMNGILKNIKNGSNISDAFAASKIFDNLTIKLLHTADYTNEYETVLLNITSQYKKRFHKSLKSFSSLIEPVLIFFIALIVLWLILAIMLPIWNLGAVIN